MLIHVHSHLFGRFFSIVNLNPFVFFFLSFTTHALCILCLCEICIRQAFSFTEHICGWFLWSFICYSIRLLNHPAWANRNEFKIAILDENSRKIDICLKWKNDFYTVLTFLGIDAMSTIHCGHWISDLKFRMNLKNKTCAVNTNIVSLLKPQSQINVVITQTKIMYTSR